MDNSLNLLCEAIKKICWQLKPQLNPLSFVIITGKDSQGKSALLRQSQYTEFPLMSELQAKIYYNPQGLLLELGERWLNQSASILKNTIKKLNRCHPALQISGLVLCVAMHEFLQDDAEAYSQQRKAHIQLLDRFAYCLPQPIELALVLTKSDALAGFCEFYQHDHQAELGKALGFSLMAGSNQNGTEILNRQFSQLLETLNQQVINKMHPVRSTVKRTLIREFPLQLAAIRKPLLALIQAIRPQYFHLYAVYLTSAEQGGTSIDRINQRIAHEYALTVQNSFPQATNYRPYFIQGAIQAIQAQTMQSSSPGSYPSRRLLTLGSAVAMALFAGIGLHYMHTADLLDEASKELIAYETLKNQNQLSHQALFHLAEASKTLNKIHSNRLSSPSLSQLKQQMDQSTEQQMREQFLPAVVAELEKVITNAGETPATRYKALKIYLMLGDRTHLNAQQIQDWFNQRWQQQPSAEDNREHNLLKQVLLDNQHPIQTNAQLIQDARNDLNALPTSYLFYSLAKESFNPEKVNLEVSGFNLASNQIPVYFTKAGFNEVVAQMPAIADKIKAESWVLDRPDLSQLNDMLIQTYCYDYVTWWQTFQRKSLPAHYESYAQGQQVTQQLLESKALQKIIDLVQEQTRPELNAANPLFNQAVASQFTELNLMSQSATGEIELSLKEMAQFFNTLAAVNDGGRTAFTVTKGRFQNANLADPVSMLYSKAAHFPQPLSRWAKQIADDCWMQLIKDSRNYINSQWQQTVYQEYKTSIAKRYPLDAVESQEISLDDFNRFFAPHGSLNQFIETYLKPFMDTQQAEWQPKPVDGFMLPISAEIMNEIIRANVITTMFFPDHDEQAHIEFSLQKINLDPVIANLKLDIGQTHLQDNQGSESFTRFAWPQNNARLTLDAIDGNHYELAEQGIWGLFRLLEKVNVLVDEQDSASLQILFEINSNSGRYLLKSANPINPFTPGILNGFSLEETVV